MDSTEKTHETSANASASSTPSHGPKIISEELSTDGRRRRTTTLPMHIPVTKKAKSDKTNELLVAQLMDWSFGAPYESALADVDDEELDRVVDNSTPVAVKVVDAKSKRRYLSSVSTFFYELKWD